MSATEQMTSDQHEALSAELAELEGPKRQAAIEAIARAREEGDLSENFAYHDAKNAQGLLERRITLLRHRLEAAVIVEIVDSGKVAVGSHVVIIDERGETLEFEISNAGGEGSVSTSSPLGLAVLGKRVGDTMQVKAPRSTWTGTIVEIRAA
jgi:transcription elongation factor GreA